MGEVKQAAVVPLNELVKVLINNQFGFWDFVIAVGNGIIYNLGNLINIKQPQLFHISHFWVYVVWDRKVENQFYMRTFKVFRVNNRFSGAGRNYYDI